VADAIFEERRLAEIYDPMDPDRSDLDAYVALAEEMGARSVLDIGCGTGTFACLLARRGTEVIAVDPAGASLEVARAKPGADQVRWVHGDATTLPPLQADLATMTGNVAQVFLTDDEWATTLRCARGAAPGRAPCVRDARSAAGGVARLGPRPHPYRRRHSRSRDCRGLDRGDGRRQRACLLPVLLALFAVT